MSHDPLAVPSPPAGQLLQIVMEVHLVCWGWGIGEGGGAKGVTAADNAIN